MHAQLTWVDPNEGWKYGFPKLYDPNSDGDMKDWLVEQGYPIDQLLLVRCWYDEKETTVNE